MKNIYLFIIFLFSTFLMFSQEKTLLTIDGEDISVNDFKRVYEKNLDAIDNEESKDVTKNLALFINYKLKVKEAYRLQLDTLPSYKREMETYKNQLSAPYLQDTTFIEDLVKDVYFRKKNEVKAKHILVRIPKDATPNDTLIAYKKIDEIRNRIINGEDFEKVAFEESEDASAQDDPKTGRKGNRGNLGYFSAFDMVSEFEDNAYSTKVGEVSKPFRTQFGYHILKVDALRPSLGEIQIAHILIADTTAIGKSKIDTIYYKLQNNENFNELVKEFSEDENTKQSGGKLRKFRSGRMLKPIDAAAFSLKNIGDYSAPIKTRYGWHIIMLIERFPIKSFEELKNELRNKIKRSSRMQLSEIAVLNKLKAKYKIVENEASKKILDRKVIRAIPKDSLQNTLFTINNKEIKQELFINYLRNRFQKPVYLLYEDFKNKEILSYYKENLVFTEPEYAYTLKEYEDGLLLFELMQQKIWNASTKDTLGLKKYFNNHKEKYNSKKLKNNKGEVMNDYQNFLEENWIADLRKRSKIKIRKRQLKKLIKHYEK